jgi:hypothetical protein
MSANLTCIGFLIFFQCHEAAPVRPDPEPVVCSGPAVPILTLEEAQQTIPKVRRFMNKVKRNRLDNNCPETIERKELK